MVGPRASTRVGAGRVVVAGGPSGPGRRSARVLRRWPAAGTGGEVIHLRGRSETRVGFALLAACALILIVGAPRAAARDAVGTAVAGPTPGTADQHLLPGQGDQDAAGVLRELVRTRYTGHVVVEVQTRDAPEEARSGSPSC